MTENLSIWLLVLIPAILVLFALYRRKSSIDFGKWFVFTMLFFLILSSLFSPFLLKMEGQVKKGHSLQTKVKSKDWDLTFQLPLEEQPLQVKQNVLMLNTIHILEEDTDVITVHYIRPSFWNHEKSPIQFEITEKGELNMAIRSSVVQADVISKPVSLYSKDIAKTSDVFIGGDFLGNMYGYVQLIVPDGYPVEVEGSPYFP